MVAIADNNLHEVIETEVEGGALKVFVNENICWAKEKKVMVTVEKLSGVETTSGANVYLSGLAKDAELETSSGANLKGQELKADKCKMRAPGGGNVFATVVERVEAKASSGGNIVYYGEPSSTDIDTSFLIINLSAIGSFVPYPEF